MEGSNEYKFKVVLLGEGAVGKSSLLLRYVQNEFQPRHISTIQASFLSKQVNLAGTIVDLAIWDTAGQEKYHALGPIYYRGSNGALLIYDITDVRSFERIKVWVKELSRTLGNTVSLFIIGNKLDLEKSRTVSYETAKEYADSINALYEETSAKENVGIAAVFEKLCAAMIEKGEASQQTANSASIATTGQRTIQLVDDPTPKKRACCK